MKLKSPRSRKLREDAEELIVTLQTKLDLLASAIENDGGNTELLVKLKASQAKLDTLFDLLVAMRSNNGQAK